MAEARGPLTEEQKGEDRVFLNVYIPRTLDDVIDFERDTDPNRLDKPEMHYQNVTGLTSDITGAGAAQAEDAVGDSYSDDDESDDGDSDDSEDKDDEEDGNDDE
eukprot:CAMPEP_0177660566 /NCGR_PEP_ID=MMETSP0447-20121125/18118_1 /TAXON_ID=0 /ORGANISM="Stygamoeba regulata, Strain BSH-02190019" /LENGTH=103 /DNA_ID=CAMNT_0019165659 /DNA_START=282 /DNA_END=590 /DNA_ORIENTATION=+